MEPGRWLVESTPTGQASARGRSEIVHLGGCVLLERLVLHLPDGSSHLLVYVQGWDPSSNRWHLVQIGDHPLFLVWDERDGDGSGERFQTLRSTSRGEVLLEWRVSESEDGFRRVLRTRATGDEEWAEAEVMTYRPLPTVDEIADVPSLVPGPFHDPDACRSGDFREMDYLLGHWLSEEWVRSEAGAWRPATVSETRVEPVVAGCALIETRSIHHAGEFRERRLIARGYDPEARRWRQVVFGDQGGVRRWSAEDVGQGWMLTPEGEDAAGRLRILERPTAEGLTRRVEVRQGTDGWQLQRLIRRVRW